ncbi:MULTISPECIES: DUF7538 family protein [Halorubrum]|uniref:Uncharacterized protein n=1 Tax=Halorubrum sodomense TaxID=35743 RepID=A0A1I6FSF7_HALSD|nr:MULTISPECIES: hypothetical protein [Halorubrum]TKX53791.1 hypothetical protein EXE42_10880 [Halorubrum sp. SP3]TKX70459.1 hypothetical protein EXE45_05000 [Halorubrum sp. SP9]SFR32892.1 hypothetical protein SAMN04487937_1133 [Halorubrum sodomense]
MRDPIAALVRQEGWRAEGAAARVHYEGGRDRFAVEFYAETPRVLYWSVPTDDDEGGTAVPVPRDDVPDPLRRRIREDLDEAGIDSEVERREL